MNDIETVDVEECYCCNAPDPAGIEHIVDAGVNRGKTFLWCRTCWQTGALSVTLYPSQYPDSKAVKVVAHIEQVRRLREGWYDVGTTET